MVEGERCDRFAVAAVTALLQEFVDRRPAGVAGVAARAGAGRSGASARWATLTTLIRGSRLGSP